MMQSASNIKIIKNSSPELIQQTTHSEQFS